MKRKISFPSTTIYIIKLIAVGLFVINQGCSGSSSPVIDVNPRAYYEGGANVKTGNNLDDLVIDDLKAMLNSSRFMLMSQKNNLVYDGTITEITGSNFTATVTIYVTGQAPIKANLEATVTEGSRITGTLTGAGPGNGSFTLTYHESSRDIADLTKLDCHIDCSWDGLINDSKTSLSFGIDSQGDITFSFGAKGGFYETCQLFGSFSVIPNSNLYSANMTLSKCSFELADGDYTGLATTTNQSNPNQPMVLILTNETYGVMGTFISGST